ncbi:MAG: hypothetical protein ACREB8_02175 [Pseudolabrys sp.]
MNLRWALFIAACLLPGAASMAAAQFTPPAAPAQEPPCIKQFTKLRDDAAKKAGAIQRASARHAEPREACQLFNAFSAAEGKMLKFAVDNSVWCGIPPQIIGTIKQQHAKTNEIRTRVCQVAAAPPRPSAPSLSDALNAPIIDSSDIKTGRGTFDTLTGTPLGNK